MDGVMLALHDRDGAKEWTGGKARAIISNGRHGSLQLYLSSLDVH